MIAIYIVLSVLLLLFLVAMLPVSLTVKYKDEVSLTASVLAVKIPIYPRQKKKVKISDYSKKSLERRRRKALKKRLKAEKKLKASKRKALQKKASSSKEKKSLLDNLELIYELLSTYVSGVIKHVKVKTTRIVLTIGSDDAAKTAMLYAAASNAVALIVTFLDNCKRLKSFNGSQISVNADFVSEKCSADIEISFSMRIWQVLNTLFATALKYVTKKSK